MGNIDLRLLVDRLERERSFELCVQLADALGYRMGGGLGSVQLDIPDEPVIAVYFSLEALVDDLVRAGRRLPPQ